MQDTRQMRHLAMAPGRVSISFRVWKMLATPWVRKWKMFLLQHHRVVRSSGVFCVMVISAQSLWNCHC